MKTFKIFTRASHSWKNWCFQYTVDENNSGIHFKRNILNIYIRRREKKTFGSCFSALEITMKVFMLIVTDDILKIFLLLI